MALNRKDVIQVPFTVDQALHLRAILLAYVGRMQRKQAEAIDLPAVSDGYQQVIDQAQGILGSVSTRLDDLEQDEPDEPVSDVEKILARQSTGRISAEAIHRGLSRSSALERIANQAQPTYKTFKRVVSHGVYAIGGNPWLNIELPNGEVVTTIRQGPGFWGSELRTDMTFDEANAFDADCDAALKWIREGGVL